MGINKPVLTIVNYFTNRLIFKNGMFFELLIRCWYTGNDEKYNKNPDFILTQLTAYHHHHK
jgi:hypothetical protein